MLAGPRWEALPCIIFSNYMNLVPVTIDSIELGKPLPFNLMDQHGVLLAKKALVIATRGDLKDLANRDGGLFIQNVEAEALRRAYLTHLNTLLREDTALGVIAESNPYTPPPQRRIASINERIDWLDLQEQVNYLLRDTNVQTFNDRLAFIHDTLGNQLERNGDEVLFALIHLSATETRMYSATHSLLVCALCGLASRHVLHWAAEEEDALRKAALTMNLGMTELQDKLATQTEPPDIHQRAGINEHAQKSVAMLQALGVSDTVWLDAVRDHHLQSPGTLQSKALPQRLARLIQRADMFVARLSPRVSRTPISPAAAMHSCYFDENKAVDEAGTALIKVAGIYQPGSFVKLANNELAVVIKRGANTNMPRVAVVANRLGIPLVEPTIRETSLKDYRVVASVPHRLVKVKINLERMLPLTVTPASDGPW